MVPDGRIRWFSWALTLGMDLVLSERFLRNAVADANVDLDWLRSVDSQ